MKYPNPFFNLSPLIRLPRNSPIKIPIIVMLLKDKIKCQSISMVKASPKKKPDNDFSAIIIKEVPIAFLISRLANKTKAGMIRNPPPAPTKPVKAPTIKPSIGING